MDSLLDQSLILRIPTLSQQLTRFPQENLDRTCADNHLVKLASFVDDWRDLSPFLELTPADEKDIENVAPQRTPKRQRIDALRKWRMKMGEKATYRYLTQK